ncbi:PREDICTED: uncharacterized protein LOC106751473 [Dinoponera quadriceps]|uniref:Uncharacterized protein LOC106751473 n=1 Tax=Dinoponera quadriceps TaxID=609295 RepID=A0A6P3YBU0_DINQU|nr:PREDICTED: uncharacterized protein LOC106751473 [Dinoponera quadriceps]
MVFPVVTRIPNEETHDEEARNEQTQDRKWQNKQTLDEPQALAVNDSSSAKRQRFPCPNCTSIYGRKSNLQYYLNFECGQLPRFNSLYCQYRTRHQSNVRAHVCRKHHGCSIYAIDVCKLLENSCTQVV